MVSRMNTLPENPTARKVTQIVHDAGRNGILASEIADHFTTARGTKSTQAWVGTLLSRSKKEGHLRRSAEREMPPGEVDRRRRSYRWWITGKGIQYINPPPEPVITPLGGPPNTRAVLEMLVGAGDAGMTGPVLGRHFTLTYPEGGEHAYLNDAHTPNLQRRLNWTNQILHRLWKQGNVERGPKEVSPFYHQVPAYRWFITDKGREYLAGGLAAGRRARRLSDAERMAALRAQRRREAGRLITQAYQDYDPETTPVCVRNQAIRDLRGAGCTLDDIGGVFGLTRERIRQIVEGISVSGCRCGAHEGDYLPRSWRMEEQ